MDMNFEGRVAVVTGAGAGLGRLHALFLAARGAKVVINDLGGAVDGTGGSGAAADRVVAEIAAAGGAATANYDSVDTPLGAAEIVKCATDAYGRLDILINNAGILRDKTFGKMAIADFEAVVAVHFLGSVYCSHAAWPVMAEQAYGRIVFTTSAAGLYGNFGQANYAAAKLALVGLMNALKLEGEKHGIKVNTIAPMATTRMTQDLLPEQVAAWLKPEFVAPLVGYFSAEAWAVSGDVVEAGAGHYAKVQLVEGAGVSFGVDAEVTPEMIAQRYDGIADMSAAQPLYNANAAIAKVTKAATGG